MNRRIAITDGAVLDLEDIWTYIAADNPEAATELLIALNERFESLCEHPMLGRSRNKLLLNLRIRDFLFSVR
jgi:toxin ParE1/3/4